MNKINYGAGLFSIPNFLNENDCSMFISKANALGFEEAPIETLDGPVQLKDIRNNDRTIFDDENLASMLFNKAKEFLPEFSGELAVCGLNERFRLYKYSQGQYFKWHKDGSFVRSNTEASRLSFLIYLNNDYEGGETQFQWEKIKPEKGMALVFPHHLVHQGSEIISGFKYVLRTDVMYVNQ